MGHFGFPSSYKPLVSLKDTIRYSSILKNELLKKINLEYQPIVFNQPFVTYNFYSLSSTLDNERSINFDNKYASEVFNFIDSPNTYLMSLAIDFPKDNLLVEGIKFNRDAKLSNLDSVITNHIWLDFNTPLQNLNSNFITELVIKIYQWIIDICKQDNLEQIHRLNNKQTQIENIKKISCQQLEDKHPFSTLQRSFQIYLKKNNLSVLTDIFKRTNDNQQLKRIISISQYENCSCCLFAYDSNLKQPVELITIYARPNSIIARDQLLKNNIDDLNNKKYYDKLLDKNLTFPQNLCIDINLSNLVFYLLEKKHLAEVVKSVWTNDFLEYIKREKINIF